MRFCLAGRSIPQMVTLFNSVSDLFAEADRHALIDWSETEARHTAEYVWH